MSPSCSPAVRPNAAAVSRWRWWFWRYSDTTGDGVPDASTKHLLFDSGSAIIYVTYLTRVPGTGDLFLLDARSQDILRAEDTTSDGWPDSLSMTCFAQSDDYPDLKDAGNLIVFDADTIDVPILSVDMVTSAQMKALRARPDVGYTRYTDTDADGVADDEAGVTAPTALSPFTRVDPFDGQQTVTVYGESGMTAQIWLLDGEFQRDTLLGSGSIPSSGTAAIALSTALDGGEVVGICYSATPDDLRVRPVRDDVPQLTSADPLGFSYKSTATIDIEGSGFFTGMSVKLVTRGGDQEYTLTVSVTDSSNASVDVPQLSVDDVGTAFLIVSDGATAPSLSLHLMSVVDPTVTSE